VLALSQVVRRGAAAARRVLRGSGPSRPKHPAEADPQWATRKARRRVRRLRTQLAQAKVENAQLRQELNATRASVRDPDPGIALPPAVTNAIARVREEGLTYLKPEGLATLARLAIGFDLSRTPGLIIEAGAARGGSAIVLATAKAVERPMKVYDVFGMIPAPSDKDGADIHRRYQIIASGASRGIGGDTYYGYRDDLYEEVTESFARLGVAVESHNVELIRGLFSDTMNLDEPVALAHLDGDWYESTLTCLERIAPLLVPGGRLVLDDYYAWSGCRTAVDEYFAGRAGYQLELRAKVHVVRL
jgi:O-methyltransferase